MFKWSKFVGSLNGHLGHSLTKRVIQVIGCVTDRLHEWWLDPMLVIWITTLSVQNQNSLSNIFQAPSITNISFFNFRPIRTEICRPKDLRPWLFSICPLSHPERDRDYRASMHLLFRFKSTCVCFALCFSNQKLYECYSTVTCKLVKYYWIDPLVKLGQGLSK